LGETSRSGMGRLGVQKRGLEKLGGLLGEFKNSKVLSKPVWGRTEGEKEVGGPGKVF